MKIEGIVISCYIRDVYLTRVCVASIRFWYPDLPVWLLKDRYYGDFDTREIESRWNVQVYPTQQKNLGWGFGKLELLTEAPARRLLLLDSDIVFVGKLIDRLQQFDEDLVVESFDEPTFEDEFYSLNGIHKLDPQFAFPGYGFNTGQVLATTTKITKQDFAGLVDWHKRRVLHPEVFKMGEQGLLNYVAHRKAQRNDLSIRREPFMVRPGKGDCGAHIQPKDLNPEGKIQQLMHWAGLRWGRTLEEMPRSEILLYFENIYYQRVPFGRLLREWRLAQFKMDRSFVTPAKSQIKKVLRRSR